MYVVSFLTIGIMWLNHQTVFSYVQRIDHGFFYRNLVLLMTVVFIPYPTEVFGEALHTRIGARSAAVFYSIVMSANALSWSALWLHSSVGRRLLNDDFPEKLRRSSVAGFGINLVSIGIAFWNPYLCLAFHGALGMFNALDPFSRRVDHDSHT